MDNAQKLTQFIETVTQHTESEAGQIRQAAEREAEQCIADTQARCAARSEAEYAQAKARLTAKFQKQLSQFGYRSQTALLSRRQGLVLGLFEDLRKKLTDFSESEDYLPFLQRILKHCRPEAGSCILMREKDLPLADSLRGDLPESVTFRADSAIVLGGLSVLSADGHRCENRTLDEAYAAQMRGFYRNHRIDWGNE